jgi:Lrp/AsnC family leucine-responsive transcriptional regulator
MDSYQEFMRKKLGNIESVGYFHSIFAMKEVKNTHGVPVIIQEKSEDSE